jgi:putative transposase
VAKVVGYLKGKSASQIARTYLGLRKDFSGQNFWARGYFVSTVGKDEYETGQYIKNYEKEDQRLDQLLLFDEEPPEDDQ